MELKVFKRKDVFVEAGQYQDNHWKVVHLDGDVEELSDSAFKALYEDATPKVVPFVGEINEAVEALEIPEEVIKERFKD